MSVDSPPFSGYLVTQIIRNGEPTELRCDAHPVRCVKYFDQRDKKYKCTECVIPPGVTKITKEDIDRIQKLLAKALKD